jgi:hypothetical protein
MTDYFTEFVAHRLNDEFTRLSIDGDTDPVEGLTARASNGGVDITSQAASGHYNGAQVLSHLDGLEPGDVSVTDKAGDDIWPQIAKFAV